jgi:hypothetical protein
MDTPRIQTTAELAAPKRINSSTLDGAGRVNEPAFDPLAVIGQLTLASREPATVTPKDEGDPLSSKSQQAPKKMPQEEPMPGHATFLAVALPETKKREIVKSEHDSAPLPNRAPEGTPFPERSTALSSVLTLPNMVTSKLAGDGDTAKSSVSSTSGKAAANIPPAAVSIGPPGIPETGNTSGNAHSPIPTQIRLASDLDSRPTVAEQRPPPAALGKAPASAYIEQVSAGTRHSLRSVAWLGDQSNGASAEAQHALITTANDKASINPAGLPGIPLTAEPSNEGNIMKSVTGQLPLAPVPGSISSVVEQRAHPTALEAALPSPDSTKVPEETEDSLQLATLRTNQPNGARAEAVRMPMTIATARASMSPAGIPDVVETARASTEATTLKSAIAQMPLTPDGDSRLTGAEPRPRSTAPEAALPSPDGANVQEGTEQSPRPHLEPMVLQRSNNSRTDSEEAVHDGVAQSQSVATPVGAKVSRNAQGMGEASQLAWRDAMIDLSRPGWTQSLVQRVASQLGGGRMTLMLYPPQLGRVVMQIADTARGIELRLTSQNAATTALFAEAESRIGDLMQRSGLTLSAFETATETTDTPDGHNSRGGQDHRDQSNRPASSSMAKGDASSPTRESINPVQNADGQINLLA